MRSAITTHVLDTARGVPAAGVPVRLSRIDPQDSVLAEAITDDDGRVADLGPDQVPAGTYQLRFDTAAYYAATGQECFFPEVTVTFAISEQRHHHVPLLLSPFAYSTYRGS
ncbi:hydroxyisourate hydrolase [Nocardioides albus]|uniref:5-hydroxyisourate hydrolase n=1 Tax=Nocardioides albus TaxID=1841 RepID=A0A7W5A291_9ACTN|nr:hydroxyisourate hydrolase [Nocardioides albus]MBB3088342.1 5-hydroxyisourate hydrolase [Nocardioides albus]GGU42130.1 5-hydroxyisourate hydrolase [Nocardioides albus]